MFLVILSGENKNKYCTWLPIVSTLVKKKAVLKTYIFLMIKYIKN